MTTDQYKIWAPENRANPHSLYARMRREAPIYRTISPVTGKPVWFFTRYNDCVSILKDQRFGKEIEKRLNPGPSPPHAAGADIDEFAVINRNMLSYDPPDHTRLRNLIHKAFTPQTVESLRPRIAEIALNLVNEM